MEETELPKQDLEQKEETEMSMSFLVFGIILTIIAMVYAIMTRTFGDFVKYCAYISAAFLIITLLIFIFNIINSRGKSQFDWGLFSLMLILIPVSIVFGAVCYYSVFVLFKDIILWVLSPTISKTSAVVLSVLITLTVGLTLFYIRLKIRAIYGFTEAMVGLLVSAQRVIHEPDQITNFGFYFAILTAAIYLFVRGLDNIHQGLTKEPIDPWGTKIYTFLKKKT